MTSSSIPLSANLMTDKSRKIYNTKNATNEELEGLEGTIKLEWKTIEALKQIAYRHNLGTYDSAIVKLMTFYNKHAEKL